MTGLLATLSFLMIGDSLTKQGIGQGVEERVPGLVAQGCGGTTVPHWLPGALPIDFHGCRGVLYDEYVLPHLPADQVVILLGTNDSGFYGPNAYLSKLKALAQALRNDGAVEVIVTIPPRVWGRPDRDALLSLYRDAILSECEVSFTCGADLRTLLDQPEFFIIDGVHLSRVGAGLAIDAIVQTVPEPRGSAVAALLVLALMRRHRDPNRHQS